MKVAKTMATAVLTAVLSVGVLGITAGPASAGDTSWGKGVATP